MAKLEEIALMMYCATVTTLEETNAFNAVDRIEALKDLVEDFQHELNKYEDYCERACDVL